MKVTGSLIKGKSSVNDPANYAGPCDFIEEGLHEVVTPWDCMKIGVVVGALPFVIGIYSSYDMTKFKLHKWSQDPRYKTAKRSFSDSTLDVASEFLAFNLNWRQMRVLAPVRPLRVELKKLNISGNSHYNYYFGGTTYSARWLHEIPDRRPNDPVILYLHGGSYAIKTHAMQLDYMSKLTNEFSRFRVSTLVLDYTIGACRKWPAQLNEAMDTYNDLRRSCDNVIAFGDSCGGHLALAMLLSGATFTGCMLVSPTTDLTGNSHDEITMRESFLDEDSDVNDPLLSPVLLGSAWQKYLPQNTAMVWGSAEECVRQMKEFIEVAGINMYFEEIQGGHDCILRGRGNSGADFIEDMMHSWFFNAT